MATYKILLKKNKQRSDNKSPLYIRITANRKSSFIATGHYVLEKDWDSKIGKVKKSHPNSTYLNNFLSHKILEVQKAVIKKDLTTNNSSSKNVKNEVVKTSDNFFNYADQLNQTKFERGMIGSYKRYKTIISKIEEFSTSRNLLLIEINTQFLIDFETHLLALGNKQSTIEANLKGIRAILYQAIKDGKLEQKDNPFFNFKIKSSKSHKENLSYDEIKKIIALDLKKGTLIYNVRNYFMFSFYLAGIRVGDLMKLKWANLNNSRINYQMGKTGTFKNILVNSFAEQILEDYQQTIDGYIFPILNIEKDLKDPLVLHNEIASKTTLINKYLKQIASLAEINTKLSFHISRHSFANYARKMNMNLYDISKALGHSDIKITERYLSSFDEESLDSEMNRLFK